MLLHCVALTAAAVPRLTREQIDECCISEMLATCRCLWNCASCIS